MIQLRSMLKVLDNTGLEKVRCFYYKSGTVGDYIIGSVKVLSSGTTWERGDVVRGLVVATNKEFVRISGVLVKFDVNGVIIINKKREPLGSRVGITLPLDLRRMGHMKVISLAHIVI